MDQNTRRIPSRWLDCPDRRVGSAQLARAMRLGRPLEAAAPVSRQRQSAQVETQQRLSR
jgi:hypothetical protein